MGPSVVPPLSGLRRKIDQAKEAGRTSIGGVVLDLVAQIGAAAILIGADGRVTGTNRRVRPHLGTTFSLTGGHLKAVACRESDAKLQEVVAQALSETEGPSSSSVLVRRNAGLPVLVRVLPVKGEDESFALLIVSDLNASTSEISPDFARAFGLTPAEMRVAAGLHAGQDLAEIAAEVGTMIGTVRSQLKAVLAKTGTHRQQELTALLARTASIL